MKQDRKKWQWDDVLQLILVIFHHRQKKNHQTIFLNSKCEKKPTNLQTKQPLILLHTTKEDKFVSYYLKIDDLFSFEKLTYIFDHVRLCNFMQKAVIFWHGCEY